jgi:hypothetical protein
MLDAGVSFGRELYGWVAGGPSRSRMSFFCFQCLSEMFCGFVYFRDLKIENLLLDEDNNIKLIGMTFFFKKQDYLLSVVLLILNFEN